MSTGFSFGNTAGTQATAGFGATSSTTGALNFAKPTTTASTGFSLGGPTTATGTTGFSFGAAAGAVKPTTTVAPTSSTPAAAATGFGASTGLAGFGTNAAKPATGGLTLGAPGFGTASSGFGATGIGLAQTKTTTTATPGLAGFGATPAATKPTGLGGFGATTAASTGFSFGGAGGLGAGTTTTSSLGGNLFSTPATVAESKGLGGVDPKTTATKTGISGSNGKPGDSKAVKDTSLPPEIAVHVEELKSFVKDQRNISEEMDRMSSKQLYKIQEDVASLRQMLSLVSTGLQRNAVAIESIKQDSAKELKSAEIAQRTKDLPPSLQYENTAPSEYFARMADDFEARMVTYRQHIEELESHLSSLSQPATLTPQELAILLKKISESFIHMAAQVHVINEAVKIQKQQYLNYRKVFYGDTTDIFEKRKKAVEKTKAKRPTDMVGPTPFTGMSNAAALAMATVLNRQQQPGGVTTLGLNPGLGSGQLGGQAPGFSTGLGAGSIFGSTSTGTTGTGLGTGFGAPTTQTSTGFGASSFNFGAATTGNTATVRPLGSTFGNTGTSTGGGLFGASTTSASTGLFGTPTQQPAPTTAMPSFGLPGAANNNNTLVGFGQPDNKAPFLLQKPPMGNKKGKK